MITHLQQVPLLLLSNIDACLLQLGRWDDLTALVGLVVLYTLGILPAFFAHLSQERSMIVLFGIGRAGLDKNILLIEAKDKLEVPHLPFLCKESTNISLLMMQQLPPLVLRILN